MPIRLGQAGPEWLRRLLAVEKKVEIPRGVSIDAVSNSGSFTTTTTWSHVFGHDVNDLARWPATVRGVVVIVLQNGSASDQVTTVKFGTVEMEEIANSPAIRSGTAPGMVHAFFLARQAIPQQSSENVEVTASGTDVKVGFCYTLYGDNPLTVQVNSKSQQGEGTFAPTVSVAMSTGQRGIAFSGLIANLPNVQELSLGESEGRAGKDGTFDFGSQVGGVGHKYSEFSKAESSAFHTWNIPLAFFTVLEFVVREIKDYGIQVPALPTTAGKGDALHLLVDATNNIVWDLEYDGRNATYPWRKTGGSPMRATAAGGPVTGAGGASTAELTAPVAMEANIEFGSMYAHQTPTAVLTEIQLGLLVGGVQQDLSGVVSNAQFMGGPIGGNLKATMTSGQKVTMNWTPNNAGSWSVSTAHILLDPIRVG